MVHPLRIVIVAGARPNFMKVAPLIRAIECHNARRVKGSPGDSPAFVGDSPTISSSPLRGEGQGEVPPREIHFKLVHTGQHYDAQMSQIFFDELGIPAPDVNLEVGSGSHASQTAEIMKRFEPVLLNAFPEASPHLLLDRGLEMIGNHRKEFDEGKSSQQPSGGERHEPLGRGEESKSHSQSFPPGPSSMVSCPVVSFPPAPSSVVSSPVVSSLPDWIVVVGDVNSTLACTLVAVKMGIRVAHVEAGLRSFDRTMPEEINRIVTDSIADVLFTPSEDASENLRREGVADSRIRLVGNIMIDALLANLEKVEQSRTLDRLGLKARRYIYVTLHRPSNVDSKNALTPIIRALKQISERMPVVFPMHPRTRSRLTDFGVQIPKGNGFLLLEPVGYHDSLALTQSARCVVTDSGGLQEESTFFRTPCLTLRPSTERPVTLTLGSNRLISSTGLSASLEDVLNGEETCGRIPPMWDGKTSDRIIQSLLRMHHLADSDLPAAPSPKDLNSPHNLRAMEGERSQVEAGCI